MKFEIITRCTRPENLNKVRESLFSAWSKKYRGEHTLTHRIIFDTSQIISLDIKVLTNLPETTYYWEGVEGDYGHCLINSMLDMLSIVSPDGWVFFLDDDNMMHLDFFDTILENYKEEQFEEGYIFSQLVFDIDNGSFFTREIDPNEVKVSKIDIAQYLLKVSLIGDHRFQPMNYCADGVFIENIYKESPQVFTFINKEISLYNAISPHRHQFLPKVLGISVSNNLKTTKVFDYESDELNIVHANNEIIKKTIASFDPDVIISGNDDYTKLTSLTSLPADFRRRWIHVNPLNENNGELAYNVAMNYILAPQDDLVSIFTPIYKTKKKLLRTYESVCNQTYQNWEWVIVNDSDDAVTLKIAKDIAEKDPRVKVFDIIPHSGGIVGASKYRACSLSRGNYLVELDHDDYLLPHALEKIVSAFNEFPDAGFVYTNCTEIDEEYNSLTYGETFAFGYASYTEETHIGKQFKVADTPNINPCTIRHIVSTPNHTRAWRRETYFKIGGHNRRLTIADDYELVVRTFLETKFVKIRECCYLQFHHGQNTQNSSRGDIQRRVRTISVYYNDMIKNRFEQLGKTDWAYIKNSISWNTQKYGSEEQFVNYIK